MRPEEALLEFSHFGFQHLDLGLEFFGPGHGPPMLATVVMGLLAQGDNFGPQEPILRLKRGLFPLERRCCLAARLRGGPHAWDLTLAADPRRVPQKRASSRFFADAITEYLHPV